MSSETNQTDTPQKDTATIKVIITRANDGFDLVVGGELSDHTSNITLIVADMVKRAVIASANATLGNFNDLCKHAHAYCNKEEKGGEA